ncbi:hypothetical protein DY000_02015517 [Brassica cretica]|uniref:Uncharacterized protein n=1 Tax=Brassica cretica TaxID=69181 RepID=A0ABQ7DAU2_BRACR|nr:hypothetical protein DY000_02015517 [Brassica cretica]
MNSGGFIRNLEVQIGNSLVPVDFHVLDIKLNWNSSLLLGRAFMDTLGASTWRLETILDSLQLATANLKLNTRQINTTAQTAIDYHYGDTISRQGYYSISSWANDSYHESFAVDTALPEMRSDEYDEEYHREKMIEYHGLVMDDEGVLDSSHATKNEALINRDTNPSIDVHQTPDSEGSRRLSTSHGWTHSQHIQKYIADIIAMNGSKNFFNTQNREDDQPSIDEIVAPSMDGHHKFRRRVLHQNRRRRPHWESTNEYGIYRDKNGYAGVANGIIIHVVCRGNHYNRARPETYNKAESNELVEGIYRAIGTADDYFTKRLDDVYYPINDNIERLTTRIDELKEEMDMIRRQNAIRSEASIDSRTRPSIDSGYKYLKNRLVTLKLLEDKLNEINFFQDLMREDFSERLEDLDETTMARLGMTQHNINTLQKRMHVSEVDKEILKNQHTRGDEAIRSFIDDPPGHAGLHCYLVQVSKAQPSLAAQLSIDVWNGVSIDVG